MTQNRVISRQKATSVQELSLKEQEMVGGGVHFTAAHLTQTPNDDYKNDPGGIDQGF